MESVRVQTGGKEPIEVLALDSFRQPITGLSNLKIRVRRLSDDYLLDWDDQTFKTPGSVVQVLLPLVEVHATGSPGYYHLNTPPHTRGLDTAQIVNPTDDDTYIVTALQDGAPQNAANMPMNGEVKVGQYVDYLDWSVAALADPDEVEDKVREVLVEMGLDHLIKTNPGAVLPAAGTYIRQLLDQANKLSAYLVQYSYSYNPQSDVLKAIVWVESGSEVLAAGLDACTLKWFRSDGTQVFAVTEPAPNSEGFYTLTKSVPGLVANNVYYARAEVDITGVGIVSSGKGGFTFQ